MRIKSKFYHDFKGLIMEIRVYLNLSAWSNHKSCYTRRIDLSDGIQFPYDHTVSIMKLLYGADCIVEIIKF